MGWRRNPISWRELALAAGLAVPEFAAGQVPTPPTGPAPCVERRGGPLRRAVHHVGFTLHDRLIGYPEYFPEPPLGATLCETFGVMKARADGHEFFLYRSDFMADSTTLTPGGAQRLTAMTNRLPRWLGPIVLEWTPDRPGLAEARREAVLVALRRAGIETGDERVLVGPSPYNGLNGQEANQDYQIYLERAARAPTAYGVSPTVTNINQAFGGGTSVGGGGAPR
jgi:hypothetical protein